METFILRSISGGGKSTEAASLRKSCILQAKEVWILSADDFFTNPQTGVYRFTPKDLPKAHAACLRRMLDAVNEYDMGNGPDVVIVDNTNTTVAEMAPYVALGQLVGQVKIITIECDPELGLRNVHGVPLDGLKRQAANLKKGTDDMPPWWDNEIRQAAK